MVTEYKIRNLDNLAKPIGNFAERCKTADQRLLLPHQADKAAERRWLLLCDRRKRGPNLVTRIWGLPQVLGRVQSLMFNNNLHQDPDLVPHKVWMLEHVRAREY